MPGNKIILFLTVTIVLKCFNAFSFYFVKLIKSIPNLKKLPPPDMVDHLLRHSKWFTTLIEERSGRGSSRQQYTGGVKDGRRYVVIRSLCLREGRNCKPHKLWVEEEEEQKKNQPY